MNILKKFKNLDKFNKIMFIATFIVIILLIANMVVSIIHLNQYRARVNSGNERWQQVEIIIENQQRKIDRLEKFINENIK